MESRQYRAHAVDADALAHVVRRHREREGEHGDRRAECRQSPRGGESDSGCATRHDRDQPIEFVHACTIDDRFGRKLGAGLLGVIAVVQTDADDLRGSRDRRADP